MASSRPTRPMGSHAGVGSKPLLDGPQALYKVGKRLEERGLVTLLQPELTRAALHDYRLGHLLAALCAANLH